MGINHGKFFNGYRSAYGKLSQATVDGLELLGRNMEDDPDLKNEIRKCFIILADISRDLGWHDGAERQREGKGQVALWSLVHGYAQLVNAGRFKKDNMKGLSILDVFRGCNGRTAPRFEMAFVVFLGVFAHNGLRISHFT